MSTSAQITANQANAQQSTGPVTDAGKAASSQNRRTHGFTGRFALMTGEDPEEFTELITALIDEHQPSTVTENILVEKMAQHFWTAQRATNLQAMCFGDDETHAKYLALYMRYQTTHDRAFHKCLSDLLKLRAERRKTLESETKLRLNEAAFCQRAEDSRKIGFESQKQREADQARKQELHEARVRLANAQAENKELDTDIRGGIEAPLPGHVRIPYDTLKHSLKEAFREVANAAKAAA
jgi:hypothetical protein